MLDQSASSVLEVEEIKRKLIKKENLTVEDLEKLKIYARNPKSCQDLSQTTGLIDKLAELALESDNLNTEALKVLINIATNEGSARNLIGKATEEGIKKSLQTSLNFEEQFLLARLLFLISIDYEGANLLNQSAEIETFITETFDKNSSETRDNTETGKTIIDILRFRYNLVKHGLKDHFKTVEEVTSGVLNGCVVSSETVNILGSCLNICLGNGPESVIYEGEIDKFIKILELMIKLYLKNENKDYLGTTLMISLKLAEKEESRKLLRRSFLKSHENEFINEWKKLLVVSDTSITFLTGEFLLKLCKGNVARLLRHVSFESAAGFLYSKGLVEGAEKPIDPEGDSSDEEFFNSHSVEPNHTPLVPETEEEEQELEYLMKRISEYNSKVQNYQN